jgi:vacuolar protein sorting-associated protein 35
MWTGGEGTPASAEGDSAVAPADGADAGGEKEQGEASSGVRKFRGIPENVRLFEVFWQQVVELIKARPDLPIQDITALLVSLINLSLSCYPDQLEYVDQVLAFAQTKVAEYGNSTDLYTPTTTSNLLALLLSPINSYSSVLTLLAIPSYLPLLLSQPFGSRRSIAHAVVSSVLKNETIIDSAEDVEGVLGMCSVLIKDQKEGGGQGAHAGVGSSNGGGYATSGSRRGHVREYDAEDLAEEQGWVARMVHLFRSDDLEIQFQVSQSE